MIGEVDVIFKLLSCYPKIGIYVVTKFLGSHNKWMSSAHQGWTHEVAENEHVMMMTALRAWVWV